jgi:hypothetical protein
MIGLPHLNLAAATVLSVLFVSADMARTLARAIKRVKLLFSMVSLMQLKVNSRARPIIPKVTLQEIKVQQSIYHNILYKLRYGCRYIVLTE